MATSIKPTAKLLVLLAALGLSWCRGLIEPGNPLVGYYNLESLTAKLEGDTITVAAPQIVGDMTISDSTYEIFYGLYNKTGNSLVDTLFRDRHFKGEYELLGEDSIRLYQGTKKSIHYTDWHFHRTAKKLTLDNDKFTYLWLKRPYSKPRLYRPNEPAWSRSSRGNTRTDS